MEILIGLRHVRDLEGLGIPVQLRVDELLLEGRPQGDVAQQNHLGQQDALTRGSLSLRFNGWTGTVIAIIFPFGKQENNEGVSR